MPTEDTAMKAGRTTGRVDFPSKLVLSVTQQRRTESALRAGATVGNSHARNAVFWYPFITYLKGEQHPSLGLTFSQIRWQKTEFVT